MITGTIATLLGIYPLLSLLTSTSVISIIGAQLALVILAAWFQGPMNLFMASLFPAETRYSGLAFSYCIGMAIFGGTTPMISTFLVDWTGNPVTPAFYVILGSVIGLISVIYSKRKAPLGTADFSYESTPVPFYTPA